MNVRFRMNLWLKLPCLTELFRHSFGDFVATLTTMNSANMNYEPCFALQAHSGNLGRGCQSYNSLKLGQTFLKQKYFNVVIMLRRAMLGS